MAKRQIDLRAALAAHPERFRTPTAQRLPVIRTRVGAATAQPPQFPRPPLAAVRLSGHEALNRLQALGLSGMARTFARLDGDPDTNTLSRTDWLAQLLDGEATERDQRRLRTRLRSARLRYPASLDNVDYRAKRDLDRALFRTLAAGQWIGDAQNVIVEGPTGVGKTWLACALGHKACRDNRSVLYQRVPRMFADLALARGTGRYSRLMRRLCGVDLLILDDWGLVTLRPEQRDVMLEIAEERYLRRSTLFISQTPIERWPDLVEEPVLATLMVDRIVHNAHRLRLSGDSMRRGKAPQPAAEVA